MKRFAAAALVAGFLFAACSPPSRAQEENTPAPAFTVKDLGGRTVTLDDYRGKILVLNFWATWCPPCREEIPDFIETYKEFKGRGLEILGLSVDSLPPQRLKEWTEKAGINYPIAMATAAVVAAYRPGEYIPATIIVDGQGRIRYRNVGLTDKETLVRVFTELTR